MINLTDEFESRGGKFVTRTHLLRSNLARVKVVMFDWDGVFNNGYRSRHGEADISESEALGIDLFRFGYWLKFGVMPYLVIVNDSANPNAQFFALREKFDAVFIDVKEKIDLLAWLEGQGFLPEEVMYTFDDFLDVPLAYRVGLRMFVRKNATPVLEEYLVRHHLMDYAAGSHGGEHAVRELMELSLMMMARFEETVDKRIMMSDEYLRFAKVKEGVETKTYRWMSKRRFEEVD